MVSRNLKTIVLLGLLTVVAGCASDEISTAYLSSRAAPPLKVPGGLQQPQPDNGESSVDNLSAEDIKSLQPQKLLLPPRIIGQNMPDNGTAQASNKKPSIAELNTDANGASYLQISLDFDRAWSRIRQALMSSGFTITDINRSTGQFYIRYRDPDAGRGARDEFVLNLLEVSGGSRLLVRSPEGQILSGDASAHILKLIRDNL